MFAFKIWMQSYKQQTEFCWHIYVKIILLLKVFYEFLLMSVSQHQDSYKDEKYLSDLKVAEIDL